MLKKGDSYMSELKLINGSCADQKVDAVVNAANRNLWAGGGICGVIFRKAGLAQLTTECQKHKTPLKDGDAVITSACNMTNTKSIILYNIRIKKSKEIYFIAKFHEKNGLFSQPVSMLKMICNILNTIP